MEKEKKAPKTPYIRRDFEKRQKLPFSKGYRDKSVKNGLCWGRISKSKNYTKNNSKTTLQLFYALCSNDMQFTALA